MENFEKIYIAIFFATLNVYAAKLIISNRKMIGAICLVISSGVLVFLAYMTYQIYASTVSSDLVKKGYINKPISEAETKLKDKNITKEDRHKFSKFIAVLKFEKDGTIENFWNKEGTYQVFVPSEENIKHLETNREIRRLHTIAIGSLENAIMLWFGSLIISLSIFAVLIIKNTHNKTIKTDEMTAGGSH